MNGTRGPIDLTISIVSADNQELLLPCLRSVFENSRGLSLEVILVDNASSDSTSAVVTSNFPQVTIIHNQQRQGFSTNNNMVLKRGQGRYLMLLNDDTLILDDALAQMVAFMDQHPDAGAVGSMLLNADCSFQVAYYPFPQPIVEGLLPAAVWSHRLGSQNATEPFEVDSVCGASLLVRREVMQHVGVLDTAFDPIYSEEIDWCYRIKQAHWKIFTLPQARIVHYGGQTMNRILPRKYELLLSHKLLFFRKHRGALAANSYRIALSLSTAVKLLWWEAQTLVRLNKNEYVEARRSLHWYLLRRLPYL